MRRRREGCRCWQGFWRVATLPFCIPLGLVRSQEGRVREALILSILLYGCECWCLTEVLLQRLRVFHAQCLRAMCRVARKHSWEHHITSVELMQRLGLDGIDFYVARRQLRWLGHVRRMPFARLPRRMLSAWVPCARPRGAPRLTFGRSVAKAMDVFDLDSACWPVLAADRLAWRMMLRDGTPPPAFRKPPPPVAPMPRSRHKVTTLIMCSSRKPQGGGGSGTPRDSQMLGLAPGWPRVGTHLRPPVPGVLAHCPGSRPTRGLTVSVSH